MNEELTRATDQRQALIRRIALLRGGRLRSFQLSPVQIETTAVTLADAERSLAAYERKIARLQML